LVDQNSQLKKEVGIAERKLLARTERIQNLEALLQDADRRLAVQNQKFEEQLAAVKDRLEQARSMCFLEFLAIANLISVFQQQKLRQAFRTLEELLSRYAAAVEAFSLPPLLRQLRSAPAHWDVFRPRREGTFVLTTSGIICR
jgi:hypothetical protein